MPAAKVSYYNRIDMGIFLCFLDLCLMHKGIRFEVRLQDDAGGENEKTLIAIYELSACASELRSHLDQLHTTELGVSRIKRNLSLDTDDVVEWCQKKVASPDAVIKRSGKNWYVTVAGCRITINAHSLTIITAHRKKREEPS